MLGGGGGGRHDFARRRKGAEKSEAPRVPSARQVRENSGVSWAVKGPSNLSVPRLR